MTVRIVLADNQHVYRQSLVFTFVREPGFLMMGEVAAEVDLYAIAAQTTPDVVFIGAHLARASTVAAMNGLAEVRPEAKVICHTDSMKWQVVRDAARASASGLVSQAATTHELIEAALTAARSTHRYFCRLALEGIANALFEREAGLPHKAVLTAREQELLGR